MPAEKYRVSNKAGAWWEGMATSEGEAKAFAWSENKDLKNAGELKVEIIEFVPPTNGQVSTLDDTTTIDESIGLQKKPRRPRADKGKPHTKKQDTPKPAKRNRGSYILYRITGDMSSLDVFPDEAELKKHLDKFALEKGSRIFSGCHERTYERRVSHILK